MLSSSNNREQRRRGPSPTAACSPPATPPLQVHQESDIVGDERNRILHKCSLSLPQAKFAFLNSQSVDQIGAGVASDNSDSTTLDWDEFLECVARNYGAILAILAILSQFSRNSLTLNSRL